VYVNYANNTNLDPMGFVPFGVISEADMAVVEAVYAGYGQDPDQDSIYNQGDAYLHSAYPLLTFITGTTVSR
jgi:peptidyl-prolyl cis-trans isomerase A (cyclophilin A)